MAIQRTRLEDVDYYLPLHDEDGEMDPEAYYHRSQLAQGRDFATALGLTGVSDRAAWMILADFPELEDVTTVTPEVRTALIGLGKIIEQTDPENPASEDRVEVAIANLGVQITK